MQSFIFNSKHPAHFPIRTRLQFVATYDAIHIFLFQLSSLQSISLNFGYRRFSWLINNDKKYPHLFHENQDD